MKFERVCLQRIIISRMSLSRPDHISENLAYGF